MKRLTQLIVALDVPDYTAAETLVKTLTPQVKFFKIGSQLFTACGPNVVNMVHAQGGNVFLDLKFHDIPNTVVEAGLSARRLGVFMFNVHASGGEVMMRALMQSQRNAGVSESPIVLWVTVLTSMDRPQLNSLGVMRSVKNQVLHLSRLSQKCGLDGVVCSGQEIRLLRRVLGNEFVLVVPGVRPSSAARDDQKRIVTPGQAAAWGADYIVVGRPIIAAPDPRHVAQEILQELHTACRGAEGSRAGIKVDDFT